MAGLAQQPAALCLGGKHTRVLCTVLQPHNAVAGVSSALHPPALALVLCVSHCPQLCKHEFVFTPVYAKDAPTRLPWPELVAGLVKRAVGGVKVAHRVWVVACVWLIAVPWITCLAWRLAFLRSFDEVPRLLRERWNVLAIATDCIQVREHAPKGRLHWLHTVRRVPGATCCCATGCCQGRDMPAGLHWVAACVHVLRRTTSCCVCLLCVCVCVPAAACRAPCCPSVWCLSTCRCSA